MARRRSRTEVVWPGVAVKTTRGGKQKLLGVAKKRHVKRQQRQQRRDAKGRFR